MLVTSFVSQKMKLIWHDYSLSSDSGTCAYSAYYLISNVAPLSEDQWLISGQCCYSRALCLLTMVIRYSTRRQLEAWCKVYKIDERPQTTIFDSMSLLPTQIGVLWFKIAFYFFIF